ncbi:hypothetical protein CQY20_06195 [Mycolicibacterium agri]|uniref:Uncharacterized protein n=1 Tax=Mycolicibacterium agri TaxID=36811 RepID=A0A2A7NAJ9_MYCAG|nr:hypothetical protein [Mycolicibacterium agri]PEG40866.1 hypothetical protein CQY20_06195 [Mycolicibacterium agri]GFG52297.1 hypothetical protein MAGR_37380 [Mycolicibacterium agri]
MDATDVAESATVPDTLDEWQTLLERAFFARRDTSAPFIFDLEVSDEVRQWTGELNLSAKLGQIVAANVDLNSANDVFRPLKEAWRQWSAGSRTSVPPNLAVLALSVAAASQMHRDATAISQAYYYRLAQLLAPQMSHDDLMVLRGRLDESFGVVAQWWRELSDWVDANPQVGFNTIRGHQSLTRIGYPISQAIIRRSDRMRLTRFFEKLDLKNLGVPDKATLLSHFEIWSATPRDLSATLLAALADQSRRLVLASYLHRLASEWDGVVLTPEGATQLDIRFVIDFDDFTSRWAITKQPGKPRLTVEINDKSVELTSPEYGAYYHWHGPMPPVQAWRTTPSVTAKGPGVAGRFVFPPLQPMRAHPDVGWISVDNVEPYTPHVLLVAPGWRSQIERVLNAAARTGWRLVEQKPGAQLVVGRLIYIRVEIEDVGAFKSALTKIDPSLARALRSSASLRPRLVNGLQIFTNLGSRHYVQGGEPDLLLPAGDTPRTVPASLDGTPQAHPFQATGFPIPLRRIGPLEVGTHVLDVDGEKITFDIHTPNETQAGPSSTLGWVCASQTNEIAMVAMNSVGLTAISGAVVDGNVREPHLLRRVGRQYSVVDRRGMAKAIAPPPPNPLFEQVGIPDSPVWEYTAPADAIWLFEERVNGEISAHRLGYAEPLFGALDSDSQRIWARVSEQMRGTNPLLDIFLRAWDRCKQHAR